MFLKINEKLENPDFEGTESKLYIKGDYIYKIYNDNNSSILHLQNLISKQNEIKQTTFPDNILYETFKDEEDNGDFVSVIGCRIKYFKNYIPLNKIECSLDEKLDILIGIISSLKELLEHNIYPLDLNSRGILVGNKIQIIDLDTFDTRITKSYDKENYIFVLKLFKHILFRTIYSDFKPTFHEFTNKVYLSKYITDYLENDGIKKSIISDMTKDDFNFSDAKNFIYYLKSRNINKKSL